MLRSRAVLAIVAAVLLAAAATVVVVVVQASSSSSAKRPNFVVVLTDDLSLNLVKYMPAVLQMEKQGVSLSSYFVVDSLCCPSRSAIFTGEYPHDDGVFANSGPDGGYAAFQANGDAKKSFAVTLQKAGYRTAMMGKYLNGYPTTDPPQPGWSEWDVADNGYNEFGYVLNQDGKQVHYDHQPKDYLVDVMSAKGADFVHTAAKSTKPFFLELATFAPHSPYVPAPRYKHTEQGLTYPRNPAYDTVPSGALPYLSSQPPLSATDEKIIDAEFRLRVRADRAVNDMIVNIRKALKATGADKNTYLIFTSDNGYHMGENRLLAGKQTPFDTDIHVPFVVVGPHVKAGTTDSRLASNIDIAPTLEQLAGTRIPSTVDGVSMVPLLHGTRTSSWQQAVLVEHHHEQHTNDDPDAQSARLGNPPSYEAIRTATAMYAVYEGSAGSEYYDVSTDPWERHNLAANGVPAAVTKALAALQHCHGATQCQAAARLS